MNTTQEDTKEPTQEDTKEDKRKIAFLPPDEVRKIAAGEVIDRPAALVREFIDNAVDAGSRNIEVNIEDGGLRRIEVIDDGCGMDREDAAICWKTHATSKIRALEDLAFSDTLGFRGEALAAAAAVSRLEVLTSTNGCEAWRLEVGPEERAEITRSRRTRGTSVRARDLFDAVPVRKTFLKRSWSEANQCRLSFIDKALAFPALSFRFAQDGKLKVHLNQASGFKARFGAAITGNEDFLYEINAAGAGFSVTVVIGGPEVSRPDRRHQYIFANGRRIQNPSLAQALEYGAQGWYPDHPIGALYITIDPSLADFNIHPAKREARFSDSGAIHHAVTAALRDFVRHESLASGLASFPAVSGRPAQPASAESLALEAGEAGEADMEAPALPNSLARAAFAYPAPEKTPLSLPIAVAAEAPARYGIRYLGRVFGLFIAVEKDDRLFIIDQHAAHERILYEEFLSKPIPRQELLVAIPFVTESEADDRFLAARQEELERLGVRIVQESGSWRVEALPADWRLGDTQTVRELLNLRHHEKNMVEHWAATLSCHGAVKDGDYLDENAALALADAALRLPVPRCPHGRPLWFALTKEDLRKAVKRPAAGPSPTQPPAVS
ncbi:MAG: DNA mismatch repair endonuclease MutL [Spirochaetaceae bacterium]|jgi:DNA mismatch repair protein MutL|nr:DNA mismatch repair endonuclease MutL [Spirochaetaceae bacterium]